MMAEQFRRFPCLLRLEERLPELNRSIWNFERSPISYLVENLQNTLETLGLAKPMVLSSSLNVSPELKAQSRIIEIAKQVGARHYVNAPGGRAIYEPAAFAQAGLTLNFLSDYKGSFKSILERLLTEDTRSIVGELEQNMDLERLSP